MGSRLRSNELRRKGMAVIVTALMLVFVIPVVGLAIDAAVLYTIKARLQTAVDAAAIAAARTLSKGLTIGEQAGNAQAKATSFFFANYPEGELGATNVTVPTPDVTESGYRRRTVSVTGSVMAPTYFMRVFGYTRTKVQATGTATRRDVNIIIVLDRSTSMQMSSSCAPMISAAKQFVALFANGRDRIGMLTYSTSWYPAFPHTMDFLSGSPNINGVINSVTCTGYTNSATAISEAYNQLVALDEPGVLNIILFFTDGVPTALTASFPVKMKEDTRYGYGYNQSSTTTTTNPTSAPPIPPYGTYRTSTGSSGPCTNSNNCRELYPNTNTLYNNMPPSSCRSTSGSNNYSWYQTNTTGTKYLQTSVNPSWNPSDLVGVLRGNGSFATSGPTAGLYNPQAASLSAADGGTITGGGTCRFTSNVEYIRRDIAYIPSTDNYGNSTRSSMTPTDDFGSGHAYQGQIRPDTPASVMKASKNATYNAAIRIRGNTRIQPVFYIIALGNPNDPDVDAQPDTDLLLRMSNDPTSPEYTDTQPDGMFVFAPDNTQLNAAFIRVASEILRIAN